MRIFLALLTVLAAWSGARAETSDPLFGLDAPALDSQAPHPMEFQLGDYGAAEQTGAATYRYSIPVPPGRRDMKPELALTYSSRAPLRGGVAAGWSLSLPTIERDTAVGTLSTPRFNATLGGSAGRLVEVEDVSAYGGTTYRLEQDDSFARFEQTLEPLFAGACESSGLPKAPDASTFSLALTGPLAASTSSSPSVGSQQIANAGSGELASRKPGSSWIAWTPDGVRHYFGSTPCSTDKFHRWLLDRQVDAYGNSVSYHWGAVRNVSGELVDYALERITYTANENAGLDAHARVDFAYAETPLGSRVDFRAGLETCAGSGVPIGARSSYRTGQLRLDGARRLASIRTSVLDGGSWRPVQEVALAYDAAAMSCEATSAPLRILSEIQRTGFAPDGSATSAPTIRFEYGPWQRRFEEASTVPTPFSNLAGNAPVAPHHGTRTELRGTLLEINGDGIPDRVEVSAAASGGEACDLVWYRGLPGGGHLPTSRRLPLPGMPWANGTSATGEERCTLAGQISFRKNQPGPSSGLSCINARQGNLNVYRFADVDGDGRDDLLTAIYAERDWYDPFADQALAQEHGNPGGIATREAVNRSSAPRAIVALGASTTLASFSATHSQPSAPPAEEPGTAFAFNDGQGPIRGPDQLLHEDGLSDPAPPLGGSDLCPMPEREPQRYSSHFVWRLYRNTGTSFVPFRSRQVPHNATTLVPIELKPTGSEGAPLGHGAIQFENQAMLDMNGDGLLDLVDRWQVHLGDGAGDFAANGASWAPPVAAHPSLSAADSAPACLAASASRSCVVDGTRRATWGLEGLGDVNGDGLPDLLLAGDEQSREMQVYPNTGRGFASTPIGLGVSHYLHRSSADGAFRFRDYLRVDVDGDGLQDLLDLRLDEPHVYPNVGDRFLTPSRPLAAIWRQLRRRLEAYGFEAESRDYRWQVHSDLTDGNGNGVLDLVVWSDSGVAIRSDHLAKGPPRRLVAVDNGAGTRIEFRYAPVTDPDVVVRPKGTEIPEPIVNDRELPHLFWVVREISVTDVDAAGRRTAEAVTSYAYETPVYGAPSGHPLDPRRFLGFSGVTRDLPLGGRVVQHFDYARFGDANGRLVLEESYDRDENVLLPVTHRSLRWQTEALFAGQVAFTHLREEVTRSCALGTDMEQCGAQTQGVHHRSETWTPHGTPPSLFLHTGTQESESALGGIYRSTDVDHQVESSAAVYRVLEISTEHRDASGQPVAREQTEYEAGLPRWLHVWKGPGPNEVATTRQDYDFSTGLLSGVTRPNQQPDGPGAQYEYDPQKRFVERTTNELGHVVVTVHDPGTGVLVERRGPNQAETERWELDGLGRITSRAVAVEGLGMVALERTDYPSSHDALPRILREEKLVDFDRPPAVTERGYDGGGRVLSEELTSVSGSPTTRYHYTAGELTRIERPDPSGRSLTVPYTYERDGLGRVRRFTRPDASGVHVDYEGRTRIVEEVSDDGTGTLRYADSDAFGRLVRVEEVGGASGPAVWDYFYDTRDNVVEIVDADGNATLLDHDWTGRRLAITRGKRTWTYAYDPNGNLAAETAPVPVGQSTAAYTTVVSYDALDRIVTRTPASRGLPGPRQRELGIGVIAYTYDQGENAVGHLSHVQLPFGHVRYGYNARGLASFEERGIAALGNPAQATQWVEREYNALGQPARVAFDNGTLARTRFDVRGLPARIDWFDASARRWRNAASFDRTQAGQVRTRRSRGFRQRRVYAYDVLGRPISDRIFSGFPLRAWRSYAYDGNGDLVAVDGATGALSAAARYGYDGLHRLRTASGPQGYQAELSYSPAGNVETARVAWDGAGDSRSVQYEYGDVDPHAVDSLIDQGSGSVFARFGYDLSGNVVFRETPEGAWRFAWDGEDQLREADGPDGTEVYYYDHDGKRMLAESESGARFWFGESETHFDAAGLPARRWIHLATSGGPLARIEGGSGIEFQYGDALQNLMLTLDAQGTPTAGFLYGAFGEVVHATGANLHRRQFNGKEHDAATGLRYYGFRYYDPLALRWNAADPLYRFNPERGLGEPQHTNLYAFSLNNPVRYFDPDGLESGDGLDFEEEEEYECGVPAMMPVLQVAAIAYATYKVGSAVGDKVPGVIGTTVDLASAAGELIAEVSSGDYEAAAETLTKELVGRVIGRLTGSEYVGRILTDDDAVETGTQILKGKTPRLPKWRPSTKPTPRWRQRLNRELYEETYNGNGDLPLEEGIPKA